MNQTILKVLLVFATLLLLVDHIAACSCYGLRQRDGFHPCMAYSAADAIFTGLVTEVSFLRVGADGKPIAFSDRVARFSIDEAYKGVQGQTAEVITSWNTASCGYDFKQGQRYFVYAKRRKEDGKLTEWLCGPTVPLERAARDLAYAREIKSGESGGRIVGAVIKHGHRDIKDYGGPVPLSGVELVLEGPQGGIVSKTVTDSEGGYEFRGLGVGRYRVRAALPVGPREWLPEGKSKEHYVWLYGGMQCASEPFLLITDSSIKGRLVTPEGAMLPPQFMELVPLDENGNEISSSMTPSVSSMRGTGEYYFRVVPPGRYLVAVNARNTPGKSDPTYPLMYYPGVMSRERATVIRVAQTREIVLDDFMLTPPLKERWFSGTVLLADRTPAAGAKVILIDPNDRMMNTNVLEVTADERGQFRAKGYETFPYWIDAYVDFISEARPGGRFQFAPPVKLSTSGSVEGIELVISLSYRSQPYHSGR